MERRLARGSTLPSPAPGFAGPGHTAVEVLRQEDFALNDPFILLMDDRLEDRGGARVGGAHPHAGLETVTLLLEGSIRDGDAAPLDAGDVQWMTAGGGIVHDEDVRARGAMRVLQLWITLPLGARWTTPGFQDVHLRSLPVRREPGLELRLYSGEFGGLRSPTRNQVPVTMVDLRLSSGARVAEELTASYNAFLYVLEGAVEIGGARLGAGQVGWLDRGGATRLALTAGEAGARVILYAGEPQGQSLVTHGPFVGDSRADIQRLYDEYRRGRFQKMSELARGV